MPLSDEQRKSLNTRLTQLQQGAEAIAQAQTQAPAAQAPGTLPPEIQQLMQGIPQAQPFVASRSPSGPRVTIPPSRQQVGRELSIEQAKLKLRKTERPQSIFREKTAFSFKAVDRIVQKLESRFFEVQKIERGIGARVGGLGRFLSAKAGYDPKVTTYAAIRKAVLGQLAKTVSGESGRLTDQDIRRVAESIPSISTSREEARLQFGLMSEIIAEVMNEANDRARVAGVPESYDVPTDRKKRKEGGVRKQDKFGRKALVFPDGTFELIDE